MEPAEQAQPHANERPYPCSSAWLYPGGSREPWKDSERGVMELELPLQNSASPGIQREGE